MTEIHDSAGSYAVDALSPAERRAFEDHLTGCVRCQSEVAEFVETLAELTPLVAAAPPATLRATVLAAATTARSPGRRLAELSADGADPGSADGRDVAPRRALPGQVTQIRPSGPDEVAPLEEHPSVLPEQPWLDVTANLSQETPRRGRPRDRLLAGLVAAALVMAVVLSGWVYVSWEQNQARVAAARQETDLLTAPDAQVYVTKVNGAQVSYVVSLQRDQALFLGKGLEDPGADRTYELWVVRGEAATPAGLVREGGDVRQWLEGSLTGADGLALSREPAGGSSTPTDILTEVELSP